VIAIDTSALLAILNAEPEEADFAHVLAESAACCISAVTLLETRIVVRSRFGIDALNDLDELLDQIRAEIVPFDEAQLVQAFAGFEKYGKGLGTPAKLNFGDCASYALAKSRNIPLLYKGADFVVTDIVSAG
jgi:ribonuclease VapC